MIAIIDGCGSNIASVQFSLQRLGYESVLTHDPDVIRQASHVILPGVGHAKKAMQQLQDLGLVDVIRELKQPVLGICLGMQLLYDFSEEGDVDCLGIIPGRIKRMPEENCILPHMGWNSVEGLIGLDPPVEPGGVVCGDLLSVSSAQPPTPPALCGGSSQIKREAQQNLSGVNADWTGSPGQAGGRSLGQAGGRSLGQAGGRSLGQAGGRSLGQAGGRWRDVLAAFCRISMALSKVLSFSKLKGRGTDYVYFVHSYSAPINEYTLTQTEYAEPFTSMVKRDNFVGMQFHPEKSGDFGEQLLSQFLKGELA